MWAFLRTSGLTTGRNAMLYKDDVPNVEVGAEVGQTFARSGRVVPSSLPAGRAATAVARGAPSLDGLARTHAAVREWCVAAGGRPTGVRWELYGHWREDQDPATYETEIYWLRAEPSRPVAARRVGFAGRAPRHGVPGARGR